MNKRINYRKSSITKFDIEMLEEDGPDETGMVSDFARKLAFSVENCDSSSG